MSYFPEANASPFTHHFGYYGTPASNAVNQRLPLSSSGFSLAGCAINAGGQLVLDAGVCVMLQLALLMERNDSNTYTASARWYDVTAGAFVGASASNVLASFAGDYLRAPCARVVLRAATSTTLECRLSATSGGNVSFTGAFPATYHGRGWFSVTRCV